MGDSKSCEIFSKVLKLLAENPTREHIDIAHELYAMTRNYDFTDYELDCNDALVALELARYVPDPDFPGKPAIAYGPIPPAERRRRELEKKRQLDELDRGGKAMVAVVRQELANLTSQVQALTPKPLQHFENTAKVTEINRIRCMCEVEKRCMCGERIVGRQACGPENPQCVHCGRQYTFVDSGLPRFDDLPRFSKIV